MLKVVNAVMEVLYKSHYGNNHLQMGQNPITIAEDSGLCVTILNTRKYPRCAGTFQLLQGSKRCSFCRERKLATALFLFNNDVNFTYACTVWIVERALRALVTELKSHFQLSHKRSELFYDL